MPVSPEIRIHPLFFDSFFRKRRAIASLFVVQEPIATRIKCTTKWIYMVRFSVTMDDSLTGTIDKASAKKKVSRSDWISEACTTHLVKGNGTGAVGATTLPSAGPVFGPEDHNMPDYDEMYRNFRIDVPEFFNFGFDVIDAWANKDRNKLAMIWVNQEGVEKKFTFWDHDAPLEPDRQYPDQVRGQQG